MDGQSDPVVIHVSETAGLIGDPHVFDPTRCTREDCEVKFTCCVRRHKCTVCEDDFCFECSDHWATIPHLNNFDPKPMCHPCYCKETGTKLGQAYVVLGDPSHTPLVLLNAAMTPALFLQQQAASLAREASLRVFLVEYPGMGSEPYHENVLTEASVFTRIINMLATERETRKVVVLGHAMGGSVAMKFALKHPDKVAGVVVVGVTPRSEWGMRNWEGSKYKMFSRRHVWGSIRDSFAVGTAKSELKETDWNMYTRSGLQFRSWDACVDLMLEPLEGFYSRGLAALKCPLLFVNGQRDSLITTQDFNSAFDVAPKTAIISGARSETMVMSAHWPQIIPVVRDFIETFNLRPPPLPPPPVVIAQPLTMHLRAEEKGGTLSRTPIPHMRPRIGTLTPANRGQGASSRDVLAGLSSPTASSSSSLTSPLSCSRSCSASASVAATAATTATSATTTPSSTTSIVTVISAEEAIPLLALPLQDGNIAPVRLIFAPDNSDAHATSTFSPTENIMASIVALASSSEPETEPPSSQLASISEISDSSALLNRNVASYPTIDKPIYDRFTSPRATPPRMSARPRLTSPRGSTLIPPTPPTTTPPTPPHHSALTPTSPLVATASALPPPSSVATTRVPVTTTHTAAQTSAEHASSVTAADVFLAATLSPPTSGVHMKFTSPSITSSTEITSPASPAFDQKPTFLPNSGHTPRPPPRQSLGNNPSEVVLRPSTGVATPTPPPRRKPTPNTSPSPSKVDDPYLETKELLISPDNSGSLALTDASRLSSAGPSALSSVSESPRTSENVNSSITSQNAPSLSPISDDPESTPSNDTPSITMSPFAVEDSELRLSEKALNITIESPEGDADAPSSSLAPSPSLSSASSATSNDATALVGNTAALYDVSVSPSTESSPSSLPSPELSPADKIDASPLTTLNDGAEVSPASAGTISALYTPNDGSLIALTPSINTDILNGSSINFVEPERVSAEEKEKSSLLSSVSNDAHVVLSRSSEPSPLIDSDIPASTPYLVSSSSVPSSFPQTDFPKINPSKRSSTGVFSPGTLPPFSATSSLRLNNLSRARRVSSSPPSKPPPPIPSSPAVSRSALLSASFPTTSRLSATLRNSTPPPVPLTPSPQQRTPTTLRREENAISQTLTISRTQSPQRQMPDQKKLILTPLVRPPNIGSPVLSPNGSPDQLRTPPPLPSSFPKNISPL